MMITDSGCCSAHVEDRVLRPLQYFATTTPLTEDQSRARMAAILEAAVTASARPGIDYSEEGLPGPTQPHAISGA